MKKIFYTVLCLLCIATSTEAANGLISVKSYLTVKQTADKMEGILKEKGMTIFNRIKHSKAANKLGHKLRETELIIFGNPKVGSLLMKCQQSIGIDLPQKALIWQDEKFNVWVSYNNPKYLEKRHEISGCSNVIAKIEKVLAGIISQTVK